MLILKLPGLKQKGDVSDWIEAGGTKKKLLDLAEKAEEFKPSEDSELFSDSGNAHRLVRLYGDIIRYNFKPFRSWYIWDGKRWCEDITNQIFDLAEKTVQNMLKEASNKNNKHDREKLAEWAVKTSARKIKDMVFLASANQEIVIKVDELDSNMM